MPDIHPRLGRDRSVRLGNPVLHPLGPFRYGVADVDLAASDVITYAASLRLRYTNARPMLRRLAGQFGTSYRATLAGARNGQPWERDMPGSLEELQQRLVEQFSDVDEAALVVLKGHLLIEEMLDSIISTFVFHGEFVEKANLGFWRKVAIARSMSLDEHENEMWEIALKLNTLRNDLAHALDSPNRAAKTQAVIDLYFRLAADLPNSEKLKAEDDHIVLLFAVGYFLGFLSPFLDEVRRFREIVDGLDIVLNPHRHDPDNGRA